jgi:uncharacterized membrane protein YeaQ/YmgE (transglycosylase-associated protein family)
MDILLVILIGLTAGALAGRVVSGMGAGCSEKLSSGWLGR